MIPQVQPQPDPNAQVPPGPQQAPPQAQAGPEQGAGQQPGQQQPGQGQNQKATPEQQQAYDRVVIAGMRAIYGETHEQTMKMKRS